MSLFAGRLVHSVAVTEREGLGATLVPGPYTHRVYPAHGEIFVSL